MREIKFRAWDKMEKKWVNLTEWIIIFCFEGFHLEDAGGNEILGKDIELVEYTGLKDKNGKEIYEGDILRMQGSDSLVGSVTYDKGCFDFLEKWIGCMHPVEVIGNIYENPELLKLEKEKV